MLDIEKLIRETVTQREKVSASRYFLVTVDSVGLSKTNPDSFRVVGTRVDTGDKVMVMSKKATSGQALPEVGGVLRADKAARVKGPDGIDTYSAEYFHAYAANEICMTATIKAEAPRYNNDSQMWSAQIRAVDTEVNAGETTADTLLNGKIAGVLLPYLKPWEAKNPSPLTHDAKGSAIWGVPVKGINPMVTVRLAGKTINVFGVGAVDGADGQMQWPSDKMILEKITSNVKLRDLINSLGSLPPQAKEALSTVPMAVIPGLSANVGRDSLAGDSQKYLAIPEAFRVVDHNRKDEKGQSLNYPGWRENTHVHMKITRSGRMAVVDAVPGAGGFLHSGVPETAAEVQRRVAKAAMEQSGAVSAPTPAPQAPQAKIAAAPAKEKETQEAPAVAPVRSEPVTAAQSAADNAIDDFDDDLPDFGDYSAYANDLAAMETMNGASGFDDGVDDGFDDVLAQAEARQAQRRKSPSM